MTAPARLISDLRGVRYGEVLAVFLRDELGEHALVERIVPFLAAKYGPEVEAGPVTVHNNRDQGATIASGSHDCGGMVIVPCSMKTLAGVAHGLSDNLVARAADVMLKERRRLVLLARETPLNLAHLRNMTAATEMGAIVFPPLPAFYHRPQSIDEMVDDTVERALSLLGFAGASPRTWQGL